MDAEIVVPTSDLALEYVEIQRNLLSGRMCRTGPSNIYYYSISLRKRLQCAALTIARSLRCLHVALIK